MKSAPFAYGRISHGKGVLFMRKTTPGEGKRLGPAPAVLLGGLLALGVELVILLVGAAAVSRGILKADCAPQLTAAACVIGCLAGGLFACRGWESKRLIAGTATGLLCFALILCAALTAGDEMEFGTQALIELAGCLLGGVLAGALAGRSGKKKKRRPGARRN